jgi:hypothetical protein
VGTVALALFLLSEMQLALFRGRLYDMGSESTGMHRQPVTITGSLLSLSRGFSFEVKIALVLLTQKQSLAVDKQGCLIRFLSVL